MNYTYMLECGDGSLYTGWTNDIEKRLAAHRSGNGAKYTRGRGPLKRVYLEVMDSQSEAMQREAYIKKMSRIEKLALIQMSDWTEHLSEWHLERLRVTGTDGD
ncbi:MAG: GIY-YIG nuclease family protein [Clostridiales bacterium]|nr:GIY-YIG nuclease family protein [Clostridiales bacterium]